MHRLAILVDIRLEHADNGFREQRLAIFADRAAGMVLMQVGDEN